jgi:hypothetical protein
MAIFGTGMRAKTVDESMKLLEEGFEYVCQKEDLMLFRKRK